jgi:NAD(P)-dependent dehydrogenase (short-subunit alcohol dehydrogenase family)
MNADKPIAEFDAAVWHRAMAVNVYGPAQLVKHAIPHMIKQGGGSIIMTSSGRGVQGDLGYPAYGASKAALMNLSNNIAVEYGKHGIRSNAIVVGFVLTPKNEVGVPDPMKDMLERHSLTPYVGAPRHIADTVAFLASDESAFITGSAVYCDGGIALHSPPVADMRDMALQLVPSPT